MLHRHYSEPSAQLGSLKFYFLLILAMGPATFAQAGPMLVVPELAAQIKGLTWDTAELVPVIDNFRGTPQVVVPLKGRFQGQDTHLFRGSDVIQPDPTGNFEFKATLIATHTKVEVFSVDPYGELKSETIEIVFPEYDAFFAAGIETARRWRLTTGAGITILNYQQTSVANYSQTALTAKAAYAYALVPRLWSLEASGYVTVVPISENYAASARFLGLNLRAGYLMPQFQGPWFLSFYGGAYYTTSFVNDNLFGFKNLAGPQLYPVAIYALKEKQNLTGYFKFSPITDGLNPLSLSNHEIAFGFGWQERLEKTHTLSISADFSWLTLNFQNISVSTSTITLGSSYGW